jgi:hypothetical protein
MAIQFLADMRQTSKNPEIETGAIEYIRAHWLGEVDNG